MKVHTANLARSAHRGEDLLAGPLPEVAFVGRSNVGKSSLLNRLLGRKKLAYTGSTPGRTRSVNYYLVNHRLHFVDLPGYGFSKAGRKEQRGWAALVRRYFEAARGRAHVVQLVDAKVGATPLDAQASEYLDSLGYAPTVVATKIDRLPRSGRARALAGVRDALGLADGAAVVPFSARSGEGVQQLWTEIEKYLRSRKADPNP